MRDGSLRHLELFKITGIVSFPSFHAASAVLYIWALSPVRYVGGAAVILNLLMMASTPVISTSCMIDVFGGVALAVIGIWLAKYLPTWCPRRRRHRPRRKPPWCRHWIRPPSSSLAIGKF